jgi:P pilus assembly chaperone PapD
MIFINYRRPITYLKLKNQGRHSYRFQVRLYSWKQTLIGKMLLKPAHSLIYFPRLLSIPPGRTRIIRIGSELPTARVEKSYRLLVRQLSTSTAPGQGVSFLLAMSVPVFILPQNQIMKGKISNLKVSHQIFSFSFVNSGSIYYTPQQILVTGTTGNGKKIFSKKLMGWYVLPGESRIEQVKLPAAVCGKIKKIKISAKVNYFLLKGRRLNKGGSFTRFMTAHFVLPENGCLP